MNKIKALAEGIYKKYGTADPFLLCDELSINTFRLKMPDRTNGLYYHIKGKKIILINLFIVIVMVIQNIMVSYFIIIIVIQ